MPLIRSASLGNHPENKFRLERSHVAGASKKEIKKIRSLKGYDLTITVGKGIPIWMTQEANQATRSVGRGMTGPELAFEFLKVIEAGHHPFEPWISASFYLGGDETNTDRFNKLFCKMIVTLENDKRVFGGKDGDMLFEKWFCDSVIKTRDFKRIKVGNYSFKYVFNSVFQPMGPRSGKAVAALQTLVISRRKVCGINGSFLSEVPKGLLGTFSGSSYNLNRQMLGLEMATTYKSVDSGSKSFFS